MNWQLPNNLENQRKKSKAEQHEKLKHFRTNRREKKETKKAKAKKLAISSNWNRRLQSYPFGWGPFDQEEAFMSSDLTYLELMNMGIQMGDIVTDAIYTRKPMNLSLLFP